MAKISYYILIFCLVIFVSSAMGQMNGTIFKLSAGAPVGGGGTSASATNVMTGSVPLTASGVSSGGSYIMHHIFLGREWKYARVGHVATHLDITQRLGHVD